MSKHILRKRTVGHTTVSNNVVKALKNNLPALGLYLYLLSLPDEWEFHKTHICKECKIGIKKLEKLLKELSSFELVQHGQKRNSKGQFELFYIDVYDTETIKINNLEKSVQPVGQNCRTVETDGRFREAIKETYTNKEIKEQNKYSCSSGDEPKFFDDFWDVYPRKQKKKEVLKIWKKNNFDQIAELIIEDVIKRYRLEWKFKEKEFIPLPSSYLNGERWKDEIIEPSPKQTKQTYTQPEVIRPKYRDYTEERLQREQNNQLKGQAHGSQGSEAARHHTRGNGVRQAKDYLL